MMDTVYNALKNEYDRQKRDGFCAYELEYKILGGDFI